MFAKIREIKNGQQEEDDNTHDVVTIEMEKLSGTIQRLGDHETSGYPNWFINLTGIGFNWHKSWLNFNPRLTLECPQCGEKRRVRVYLKEVEDLNEVKLKNPVKCKNCGIIFSFVDIETRKLL